jgi:hypothetical protein
MYRPFSGHAVVWPKCFGTACALWHYVKSFLDVSLILARMHCILWYAQAYCVRWHGMCLMALCQLFLFGRCGFGTYALHTMVCTAYCVG